MDKQLLKNIAQKAIETRFAGLELYSEVREVTAVLPCSNHVQINTANNLDIAQTPNFNRVFFDNQLIRLNSIHRHSSRWIQHNSELLQELHEEAPMLNELAEVTAARVVKLIQNELTEGNERLSDLNSKKLQTATWALTRVALTTVGVLTFIGLFKKIGNDNAVAANPAPVQNNSTKHLSLFGNLFNITVVSKK